MYVYCSDTFYKIIKTTKRIGTEIPYYGRVEIVDNSIMVTQDR